MINFNLRLNPNLFGLQVLVVLKNYVVQEFWCALVEKRVQLKFFISGGSKMNPRFMQQIIATVI